MIRGPTRFAAHWCDGGVRGARTLHCDGVVATPALIWSGLTIALYDCVQLAAIIDTDSTRSRWAPAAWVPDVIVPVEEGAPPVPLPAAVPLAEPPVAVPPAAVLPAAPDPVPTPDAVPLVESSRPEICTC
jgi:hypothetical protein